MFLPFVTGYNFIAQEQLATKLVEGVSRTRSHKHHSIGVATPDALDFTIAVSVRAAAGDAITRDVTSNNLALISSLTEGSTLDQSQDSWLRGSLSAAFVRGNARNTKFVEVTPANFAAVAAALPGAIAPIHATLSADGQTLVIPSTKSANETYYGHSYFVPWGATYSGKPGTFTHLAAGDQYKGGQATTSPTNPVQAALDSVRMSPDAKPPVKYATVDAANGVARVSPEPDIVTGSGEFPYSLPFQRYYSSSSGFRQGTYHPYTYSGPDSVVYARLGGNWTHNYQVSAQLRNDGQVGLGKDRALDAAVAITGIVAMDGIARSGDTLQTKVVRNFVADWIGRQFRGNQVNVNLPPSTVSFTKLPSGAYAAAKGRADMLTVTGATLAPYPILQDDLGNITSYGISYENLRLTYNDANGTKVDFEPFNTTCGIFISAGCVANPNFSAVKLTNAEGAAVQYYYDGIQLTNENTNTHQNVPSLGAVGNNLGRTLNFSRTNVTTLQLIGQRITGVTDESGRSASFSVNCTVPMTGFTCDSFSATNPNSETTRYEYTATGPAPNPADLSRPSYRMRRLYTPLFPSTAMVSFEYDEIYRIRWLDDQLSRRSRYLAGGLGYEDWKPSVSIAPTGDVTTAAYNEESSPLWVRDPLSRLTSYTYDGSNRLVRQTMPELNATTYDYDYRSNQLVATRLPKSGGGSISTSTSYVEGATVAPWACSNIKTCNKPATSTSGRGYVTDYTWNGSTGLLTQVRKPMDSGGVRPQTDFTYTLHGPGGSQFSLLTQITEKVSSTANEVTAFAYNPSNKYTLLTSRADPSGLNLTTTFTFDTYGNVTGVQNPRTDVTAISNYAWDPARRLTHAIDPDPDGAGPLARPATKYQYDANSRLTRLERGTTTVPNGSNFTPVTATAYAYDAVGNRTKTNVAPGTAAEMVTQVSYDGLDRPTCTAQRMNPSIFGSLPASACTLGTTGSFGPDVISQNVYNAAGELTIEKRAVGTALAQDYATYTYSANGQRASIKDARNNTVTFSYDVYDRPDRTTFPDASYEQNAQYDNDDNLLTWRTRAGVNLLRTYDNLNRKLTENASPISGYWNIQGRVWAYDLKDRPLQAGISGWNYFYTYDPVGRLATHFTGMGTWDYTWDRAGNLLNQTYPDGSRNGQAYDAANRKTAGFFLPVGGLITYGIALGYDSISRRSQITFHDNSTQAYSYDAADRITSIAHAFPAAATDNVTFTYGYDPAAREISRTISNAAYQYAPGGSSVTYGTADALNRYPTVGGTTYTWALEGTLSSNTTWDFVYDEENRLIWSGKGSLGIGDWTPHDALGVPYARQTVAPTGTDTLTYFTNDASRPEVMFERLLSKPAGSGSWNTVGDRAYLPGVLPDERLLFKDTDGTIRYPHTDRQGTTIALSEAGGAVAKFKYDPFGQSADPVTLSPSSTSYWWRYTGQRLDPFNNTYNYKARAYSPSIGRFLQPDPSRFDEGPALYQYVSNDPLNKVDPTGREEGFFEGLYAARQEYESGRPAEETLRSFYPPEGGIVAGAALAGVGCLAGGCPALAIGVSAAARPAAVTVAGRASQAAVEKAATSTIMSRSSLQHAFKHAKDFGVSGNANNKTLTAFESALRGHMSAPGTKMIEGSFRGQAATHFVNPKTGLNVIKDSSGKFLSGWRLNKLQLEHVLRDGRLGGG